MVQVVQYLSKDLDVILRTPWYVRSVFYTACFYAFMLGRRIRRQPVHLLPVLMTWIGGIHKVGLHVTR